MKIGIIHPQMAMYGGAEILIVHLANYFMSKGHDVSIITLSTKERKEYKGLRFILPEDENERIEYKLRGGSLSTILEVLKVYRYLNALCEKHCQEFDVLNPHNFPAVWCVPSNAKSVWMCNEIPDLWHRQRVNRVFNTILNIGRFADKCIVRSKNIQAVTSDFCSSKNFVDRYGFASHINNYGIDSMGMNRDDLQSDRLLEWQEMLDINDDDFVIIQTGMVSPSKNQMATLQAVNEIKAEIPNIKVIFEGYTEQSNQYYHDLKKYIEQNKLDVKFLWCNDRYDLKYLYKLANVALFPCNGQGSWLSPFEAITGDCPIIVSSKLSCSLIIQEQDLGFVTNDYANALRCTYYEYKSVKDKTEKAKEYVQRELTWDMFSKRFEELILKV